MNLKVFLILMTVVAVVSDSMLHPFYPQFFDVVFGVSNPQHVGSYIAACSLTVMLSFPVWAWVARKTPVLHLLVFTQIVTGLLCLVCYWSTSLIFFWLVSLLIMVFKASYLLIYPYIMSLENKDDHITTISLLAFVVYFSNIIAALFSGLIFELLEPQFLFIAMAGGDAIQILICLFLLLRGMDLDEQAEEEQIAGPAPGIFVYKLGFVMLILYFSAYLTEPFFSQYWEYISAYDNKIVSGLVFAIPGIAALTALYFNTKSRNRQDQYRGIVSAIICGVFGLLLQASAQESVVITGRFFYGWALFQSMVRLDLLLFKLSSPQSYAVDFSKVNLFQSLGILFSSFAAGSLVFSSGLKFPFIAAALGFILAALLYRNLFRQEIKISAATANHA